MKAELTRITRDLCRSMDALKTIRAGIDTSGETTARESIIAAELDLAISNARTAAYHCCSAKEEAK